MSLAPTRDELAAWSRYVRELCGIVLDESKGYLIETRLATLRQETGAASWSDLLSRVRSDPDPRLRTQVINAITTNETSWFRDQAPFDLLAHKLLPELIDRRTRAGFRQVPIRVLSAACSTGQEAYSVAIVLKELLGDLRQYDIRLLGIDISDKALAAASYATYSLPELERGLSPARIGLHFDKVGDKFRVKDELRATATFRKANLLEPLAGVAPFDLVFCRNVAIYFSESDKVKLFRSLGRLLAPDGALLIGATESLASLCPEFEPKRHLRSVYYQLKA